MTQRGGSRSKSGTVPQPWTAHLEVDRESECPCWAEQLNIIRRGLRIVSSGRTAARRTRPAQPFDCEVPNGFSHKKGDAMSHRKQFKPGGLRSRVLLAVVVAGATALIAGCVPESQPPSNTTTTTIPEPSGPAVVGEFCAPGGGVTVVVDFTDLDDTIRIGCAPGEQANGLDALANAGFAIGDEAGPGVVCTIDGLPLEGYPFCWLTGGFWGYWRSADGVTAWDFATTGATDGPLPVGSVEGWAWAADFDGGAPRVAIDDLADHAVDAPTCAVPDAPVLSIIGDDEVLPFTIPGGGPIEVAVQPAADDPTDAVYTVTDDLALVGLSGPTRVLARSAATDCVVGDVFDAVYDVRDTYTGLAGVPGSTSTAVAATDPALIGWATGHTDYQPGADVTANFQTPDNAVGPYSTSLVVLGNGGRITMTFDTPIADGPGDDFAVFENGFMNGTNGPLLFTELAYVEVSSNGTDFVRFDSASRQPTPVAAFGYQDPALLGGLAGKDPSGWGTVFDLTALANKAQVRNGVVDLSAITHVRLVDIVGASDYPNPGDVYEDSFGRQIFDAHLTVGSGGFDLRAVGVLNQLVGVTH